MTSARSTPYISEELTPEEQVPDNPSYRPHTCKVSENIGSYTWCQRSQRRSNTTAIGRYESKLREIVQQDQSRGNTDYELWPKLAFVTRNISLKTSPNVANKVLEKVFEPYPSKKLRSRVWSVLPLSVIKSLATHTYWTADTYGPRTGYPEIRRNIQKVLADNPSEPFSEFLYYTLGEFDKAAQINPTSIINDVLLYARGHKILESLLKDTISTLKMPKMPDPVPGEIEPINATLAKLNQHPELYNNELLGSVVPNFAARAGAAKPYFESVLRFESSPHRDDAAYMLGWLAFHQKEFKEALQYMSKAIVFGNGDYKRPAALKQTVRILTRFPAQEQITIVDSDPAFRQEPALWYVAARTAYRDLSFALAIKCAEQGLNAMNVPIDRLPATTDPEQIAEALAKLAPQKVADKPDDSDDKPTDKPDDDLDYLDDLFASPTMEPDNIFEDINLGEIVYLLEASREIERYQTYLKSLVADRSEDISKRARAIILKYSLLLDKPEQPTQPSSSSKIEHKDLRQALHLIDITLEGVPKDSRHTSLREWLHYRKIRILVQFEPKSVSTAVTAFEQEFPKSQLMDDALAEQVYAEGFRLKDVNAAQRTFRKLVDNFSGANALDNAHTWMAIIYRCAGRLQDSQKMNREIIRSFPMTRHARYALERMSNKKPGACGRSNESDG
jgi:tetratricopeptide (TPR) repeat protein